MNQRKHQKNPIQQNFRITPTFASSKKSKKLSSVLQELSVSLSSGIISTASKRRFLAKIEPSAAFLLPCPSSSISKDSSKNRIIGPVTRSTSLSLAYNFPEVLRYYKNLTSTRHISCEKKHYINSLKRSSVVDKIPPSSFYSRRVNSYRNNKPPAFRASSETSSLPNIKPDISFTDPVVKVISYNRPRDPLSWSVTWGPLTAIVKHQEEGNSKTPTKSTSSVNLCTSTLSIKYPHSTLDCERDYHPHNGISTSDIVAAMKRDRPFYDSVKKPASSMRSSYSHPSRHQVSSFNIPLSLSAISHSSPMATAPSIQNSSSFHSGGPLDSLSVVSQTAIIRQQSMINSPRQQRNQKIKLLKPLSIPKTQSNVNKLYDITTSDFSAAILPDSGTSSYRLRHDVSFDEGSRYRNIYKNDSMLSQTDAKKTSPNPSRMGRHLCSMPSPSHISFKETMPLSLIRMEDRLNEIPLAVANSPVTPTSASGITSFMGAVNQKQQSGESPGGGVTSFRLHKGKPNWNCKLGELSINGGGFYNTSSTRESATFVVNGNPDSAQMQRSMQMRERNTTVLKSRMSSRFMKMEDLKCKEKEAVYQDPCISAAASFQQRLTDLSLLESETIKYERSRRLRRKRNQDKDS